MNSSDQSVYIYEFDEVHPSPEELAHYFEVDLKYVLQALDNPNNAGICRGFHICWNRRRRPQTYKPVRIIEKNRIFPSIRHMSFYYHVDEDDIRDALKRPDGFWDGWHLEYVPKTAR